MLKFFFSFILGKLTKFCGHSFNDLEVTNLQSWLGDFLGKKKHSLPRRNAFPPRYAFTQCRPEGLTDKGERG